MANSQPCAASSPLPPETCTTAMDSHITPRATTESRATEHRNGEHTRLPIAGAPRVDPQPLSPTLRDRFGRIHDALRISVTDRCNLRCTYCMPDGIVPFLPADQLLSFPQIALVAEALLGLGVTKIRLTGGEPLLRPRLPDLIERLRELPGLQQLALTTNGLRLDRLAKPLRAAGLDRLNISLDALDETAFQQVSRRSGLHRVLAGIDSALQAGFEDIRLNAISLRGVTEAQVIPLAEFARQHHLTLRFIEYMPLDAERGWSVDRVLSGAAVREILERHFGPLLAIIPDDPHQPAVEYIYPDGSGRIGLINPVTEPFCGDCNRLRLTADGKLRNCLFSLDEWDLRPILQHRAPAASSREMPLEQIQASAFSCIDAKLAGHLISRPGFAQPQRAMYQIGG